MLLFGDSYRISQICRENAQTLIHTLSDFYWETLFFVSKLQSIWSSETNLALRVKLFWFCSVPSTLVSLDKSLDGVWLGSSESWQARWAVLAYHVPNPYLARRAHSNEVHM